MIIQNRPILVISLTNSGADLAQRLCSNYPQPIEHLHKPLNFTETIQERFQQGYALIFICATGIVVRTLAPVLISKQIDPPVLVLDEQGQFVIPLISGHEGGSNAFGAMVAQTLGAQLILTTANEYLQTRFVVGMGCARGCPLDLLRQLLLESLKSHDLELENLVAIASIDIKADEPGLLALANELSVPFEVFTASMLRSVEDRMTQLSDRVFQEVGCYGVAEAAALYHADALCGGTSQLRVPKRKNSQATLAVATCR